MESIIQEIQHDNQCIICLENITYASGLKLLISICNHRICETCKNKLFFNKKENPCPKCRNKLTKNDFLTKTLEEIEIEQDMKMRKYVMEQIGLEKYDPDQEHDESKMKYFDNQQQYDDYLELIEDLVGDLRYQNHVDAAYAKIAQKKKEHFQKLQNFLSLSNDEQHNTSQMGCYKKVILPRQIQKIDNVNNIFNETKSYKASGFDPLLFIERGLKELEFYVEK